MSTVTQTHRAAAGPAGLTAGAGTSAVAGSPTPVAGRPAPEAPGPAQVAGTSRSDLFAAISFALRYPDAAWWQALPVFHAVIAGAEVGAGAGGLSGAGGTGGRAGGRGAVAVAGAALADFAAGISKMTPAQLQVEYVRTFDLHRATGLDASYYRYGDTDRRAGALLVLKTRYRKAGFAFDEGESPDFLPTMCEYAARYAVSTAGGCWPLSEYRDGIETLRAQLAEQASTYAPVLHALCALVKKG